MLAGGRPMLSTMRGDLPGRDHAPDRLLDVREARGRLLDARAGRRPRMCIRIWPVSTAGKKSRPRNGTSANETRTTARKHGHEAPAAVQRQREQPHGSARARARTVPRSRAGSRPAGCATALARRPHLAVGVRCMRTQQVFRHRRHQRARQDERADHREHRRPRPSARTGSAPRPAGRTSARTRCRCTASRRTPASTICRAPSMMAVSTSLPCSRCQLMFSIVTVASSTRMPTASASPPSVMMLSVSPSAASAMIEPRIDSGIEIAMINVRAPAAEEQQDHQAGQRRGDQRLRRATPRIAARTKIDWSLIGTTFSASGQLALICVEPGADAVDDVQRRGAAVLQHRHQHRARRRRRARCWSAARCRRARCATSRM